MMSFNQIMRWSWAFLVAVTLSLGLAGCEGDDGAPGAAGAAGAAGADGADGDDGVACWDLNGNGVGDLDTEDLNNDGVVDVADCSAAAAKVVPLESCGVCHSDGSFAAATDFHTLPPIEMVSNIAFAVVGLDLEVDFDLADDAGAPLMTYDEVMRAYVNNEGAVTDYRDAATMAHNGGGNYTITIAGAADEALVDSRWVFRIRDSVAEAATDSSRYRTYFYADYPNNPFAADDPLVVSGDACQACHGPEGIRVHGSNFIASDGGEPCLVCHNAVFFGELRPTLAQVVHGYHSGIAAWEDPPEEIEITYPTEMNKCNVCHAEEAQLAAANAAEVSGAFCFTCHGSMEGLGFAATDPIHGLLDETSDCGVCHGNPSVPTAPATVAAMHNGHELDNDGILWDGVDTSVAEGAKFDWKIDNVADDGENLEVTWSASYDGAPVNVCNDDVTAGPVFHDGGVDENGDEICRLRIYRSYAQGEDFIMGTSTRQAGQPGRANVCVSNTDCVDGVATTTIPVDAIDAERGRVALNGKPLVVSVADPAESMVARAPTPTFDWLVGLGGPAPDRRGGLVVDTGKCVGCHVGSLYQHGGDRVDNVNTCLVCHNAAANEKYARLAYGVDASEAYDGKAGEAFEMKTMIHRIHSANYEFPGDRYNAPYLVYRGRGIYAFARDEADVPNWPGDGDDLPVFGSEAGDVQDHHFHAPTYPRSLEECTACHTADPVIPDQTKAMASTTDAGGTTWENQLDDVLQGAATTSCVTCHADGASKGHAFQNSWVPQVFPEGRQTIIDAVN